MAGPLWFHGPGTFPSCTLPQTRVKSTRKMSPEDDILLLCRNHHSDSDFQQWHKPPWNETVLPPPRPVREGWHWIDVELDDLWSPHQVWELMPMQRRFVGRNGEWQCACIAKTPTLYHIQLRKGTHVPIYFRSYFGFASYIWVFFSRKARSLSQHSANALWS